VTADADAAGPEPQALIAELTGAAIFLVAVVRPDEASADAVRALCGDLAGLVRAVGFRDLNGLLSCVAGFGSAAWDRLAGRGPRPAELHPFKEIRAGSRHAPATPGDLLFHIRAARMDLCFELADDVKPSYAHNALNVVKVDGTEIKIVRDNMAFGSVADGQYGTYYIGYARSPATIEQMLVNMIVGVPEGNYDRLLDFSEAVTGNLFFVPSAPVLESLADGPADSPPPDPQQTGSPATGSLNIGSLKGAPGDG